MTLVKAFTRAAVAITTPGATIAPSMPYRVLLHFRRGVGVALLELLEILAHAGNL